MLSQIAPSVSSGTPFAALSLIVAPAILTNATSLLVMSTSNRLARAVDLARDLARELETGSADPGAPDAARRLRELAGADARSILLLRALRAIYGAVAGFAMATLVSLVGIVLSRGTAPRWLFVAEALAMAAGILGVGGVMWAASLLVRETRIAVDTLGERVAAQQARFPSLAAELRARVR